MPCEQPGPSQRVHPYCVVLIVPSMRMLLNDSPRRTPGLRGWSSSNASVQLNPLAVDCSALRPCQRQKKKAPRCPCRDSRIQRTPEGQRGDRRRAQGQGADCLCRKQAQRSTPWLLYLGTSRKGHQENKPPVTQPASAACANMRGTGSLTVGTPPSMGADQSLPLPSRLP